MELVQLLGVISGVSAILAGIISVVSVVNLVKFRTDALTKVEGELRRDLKEATNALNAMVTLVKVFQAEQEVINKITAATVRDLTERMENNQKAILELMRHLK